MKGIILGFVLAVLTLFANVIINGIHTTYINYSNYFFIVGCTVGIIGGFLYTSRWLNDRRIVKKIIKNEEQPEKRNEYAYMTDWGNVFLTASAILIILSLLVVLINE